MPNVYQPGLVQIRPQYTHDPESGDTPENILWFQSATHTTPSLANLQAIQASFDAEWSNLWRSYGASACYYLGSFITDWSSATGLESSSVGSLTPVAGTGGTAAPPQVAALISYQIALRWRGGHFRTYLPYVGANGLTGALQDTLTSTAQTNLTNSVTNVITGMLASGVLGGQRLMMYKDKDVLATAALYQIASFDVSFTVATQRRRVRKVSRR